MEILVESFMELRLCFLFEFRVSDRMIQANASVHAAAEAKLTLRRLRLGG